MDQSAFTYLTHVISHAHTHNTEYIYTDVKIH